MVQYTCYSAGTAFNGFHSAVRTTGSNPIGPEITAAKF
jgi:hypothetical protein